MRRALLVVLLVVAGLLALVGPTRAAETQTATPQNLVGSGIRGVVGAVGRWAADLGPSGVQVFYAGDRPAHADFAGGTVDFAVDDVPFLGTDPGGDPDNDGGRALTYVPLVGDAVAFAYHVDGPDGPMRGLRLSPRTLLGILTGQITDWADPAITRDNHGRTLPSTAIAPVVPSASSDVTYQLTTWLAARFPQAWAAYAGRPGPVSTYPVPPDGTTAEPAAILDDVATSDGAIAFVESSQAVQKAATVAAVRNPAGFFVPPTGPGASLALRAATIGADHAPVLSGVYADPDPRAYPISYVDSLFLPVDPADPTLTTPKRQSLADLAMYAVCDAASSNEVTGYAPLPLTLTRAALQQVRRLGDVDHGVDVSAHDIAHCLSPYLGRAPVRDLLPEQTPLPRACDGAGAGPCPTSAPAHTRHCLSWAGARSCASLTFDQERVSAHVVVRGDRRDVQLRYLRLVAQRSLQDRSPVVRARRTADFDGWHARTDTAGLTGRALPECDRYVLRGRIGVRHGALVRWTTRTLVAAYAPIGCS